MQVRVFRPGRARDPLGADPASPRCRDLEAAPDPHPLQSHFQDPASAAAPGYGCPARADVCGSEGAGTAEQRDGPGCTGTIYLRNMEMIYRPDVAVAFRVV